MMERLEWPRSVELRGHTGMLGGAQDKLRRRRLCGPIPTGMLQNS